MGPRHRISSLATPLIALLLGASTLSQTRITPPANKYTIEQDLKLGQEAAAEARKELPLLGDARVDEYVETVGRRLVGAIQPDLVTPAFRYTFDVVNQKDINAFALPGGPMFLNRGMMEASKSEAEMAGVMAHEISHVVLRHGTAQATKGQRFQIGSILGQIAGAAIGGTAGNIIAQGSQFGLGAYFMKFGREYESQADILGAQILARAGYDPREMANMFKTIEAEGGSRQPEWLSSHPNPGNRFNAINREAARLTVAGHATTEQFPAILARLRDMAPALTAEQIAKRRQAGARPADAPSAAPVQVAPPSSQSRSYQPSRFLRINVPANWHEHTDDSGVTYAPEGGFLRSPDGRTTFSYGVQVGVAQGGAGALERDTDALLQTLTAGNARMRRQGGYRRETIGGRDGITTSLVNVSDATGESESVTLSTTHLRDGSVLFVVGVAPDRDAATYAGVFRRVRQTLQLTDR